MRLSQIQAAGESARLMIESCNNLNAIYNRYWAEYESLLGMVREAFGDARTLTDLTDDEIGNFFFGGLGAAEAVASARVILTEWERNIATLAASVAVLPGNDI